MMNNPLRVIWAYFRLPAQVQGRIRNYYYKRLTGKMATTHETIWTSFLYFAARNDVTISNGECNQFEIVWSEGAEMQKTLVRDFPSTDIFVFFQVFIVRGYAPLFDFLTKHSVTVNCVIDAGANVGYFTQALLLKFSPETLIGLEPERNNFLQASKNVLPVAPHAKLLQTALWTHAATVSLRVDGGNDWGVRISNPDIGNEISEALSLTDIFEFGETDIFDVVKLDIEGAEFELFANEAFLRELTRVKCLALEIHEDVGDKFLVLEKLENLRFKFFQIGELTIAWNTNFIHA
jgi:FkbM family methyltransferase